MEAIQQFSCQLQARCRCPLPCAIGGISTGGTSRCDRPRFRCAHVPAGMRNASGRPLSREEHAAFVDSLTNDPTSATREPGRPRRPSPARRPCRRTGTPLGRLAEARACDHEPLLTCVSARGRCCSWRKSHGVGRRAATRAWGVAFWNFLFDPDPANAPDWLRVAELADSQRVSTLGAETVAAAEHLEIPCVWDGDDGPASAKRLVQLGSLTAPLRFDSCTWALARSERVRSLAANTVAPSRLFGAVLRSSVRHDSWDDQMVTISRWLSKRRRSSGSR